MMEAPATLTPPPSVYGAGTGKWSRLLRATVTAEPQDGSGVPSIILDGLDCVISWQVTIPAGLYHRHHRMKLLSAGAAYLTVLDVLYYPMQIKSK